MSDATLPRGMYETPFTVERPEKASQTLLNKISDCPYSGALYLRHRGGAQTHRMARGEAIHAAIEECINLAIEEGEMAIPPEVAKDRVQAILDERVDLAMSPLEHEACRIAAWNWAHDFRLEPENIVGVEIMLELAIAGWLIRGKVDLAMIAGGEGYVYDWKTGKGMPNQETHEHDFQQQMYGLLLLEGTPEGEDVPLGKGLSGVHLNAHYPRIKREEDDHYFTRHAHKDRAQIHDFRRTVESSLAKLDAGLETGTWKASPGDHCDYCPLQSACPIPAEELPEPIETAEQALEVGERIVILDNASSAMKKRAKRWVEEEAPIVSEAWEYVLVPEVKKVAKDAEAVRRALADPHSHDIDSLYRTQRSMKFTRKKIAA